jgi:hypothetical protein
VHRFVAVAALILVAAATASAPAATAHTVATHALSIQAPPGWRVSDRLWSDCASPTQVLALATGERPARDGLLLVLESGVGAARSTRSHPSFRLPAKPSPTAGCCGMPTAAGYVFPLVQEGHDLQIFLWARDRGVAEGAVAALNTLRVSRS